MLLVANNYKNCIFLQPSKFFHIVYTYCMHTNGILNCVELAHNVAYIKAYATRRCKSRSLLKLYPFTHVVRKLLPLTYTLC